MVHPRPSRRRARCKRIIDRPERDGLGTAREMIGAPSACGIVSPTPGRSLARLKFRRFESDATIDANGTYWRRPV